MDPTRSQRESWALIGTSCVKSATVEVMENSVYREIGRDELERLVQEQRARDATADLDDVEGGA